MSGTPSFFWLHIKKSGGESFRETFTPPYVQTKRKRNFKPFIALPKAEWNDALNNYRLPLGEYDYKRMLFAKHFLYSEEEFARMFKFTIVRNPYDRAVSCWKYLMKLYPSSVLLGRPRKLGMRMSFVRFLKELPRIWEEKEERHIATHTAPIWSDLTDEEGELLVDRIYRIEELDEALPELCDRLGVQKDRIQRKNVSRDRGDHRRYYSKKARKWVEQLYGQDIERVGYEF